jgi:hypothetical protein
MKEYLQTSCKSRRIEEIRYYVLVLGEEAGKLRQDKIKS